MKTIVMLALLVCTTSAVQAAQDPQQLFQRSCGLCHNGQAAAPRKGDVEAWKPRLAKGMDTLVKHVTEGFNAMPVRGLCFDCTQEDYLALITLMSAPE
ncbi:c-type cytochrome [Pseudomonas sp. 21LCFQ010]|uniref:c-type cytochrome n=1 Tax=Pseudomonas sp. 21LCFQ010 TaxID=2957506 RepID=UPI002097A222|nr:c-type cytochrome [Pseudomonas sp. 21LCFQ010]MCO8166028.1 c-type cytochrome [Pseudomonas sp. 21LCFQ010]